jgi:hypothetical protein
LLERQSLIRQRVVAGPRNVAKDDDLAVRDGDLLPLRLGGLIGSMNGPDSGKGRRGNQKRS